MDFFKKLAFKNKSLSLVLVSILTQVIPIIVSPVFSRIYTPSQFGEFAILNSYAAILLIFFTGKYELALLLPKHDIDIRRLFQLCLLLASSFAILILLAISLLYALPGHKLWNLNFEAFFLIIPLFTLQLSFYQLVSYLFLYLKFFKELSTIRVIKSTLTVMLTLFTGIFFKHINGLILGTFCAQIVFIIYSLFILQTKTKKYSSILSIRNYKQLLKPLKQYANFPKYSMPADMVNALVSQAPIFILSTYFSKESVGYYGFVLTVIQLPLSIIASAVLDVFKESATKEFKIAQSCLSSFKKTFYLLLGLAIIPSIVVIAFGPSIFGFLFGKKWIISGMYAQILIIMFIIKFITSPLSYTFILAGKQKLDFLLHIIIFVLLVITFFSSTYFKLNISTFLILISGVFSTIYLFYLIKSYQFAKGDV